MEQISFYLKKFEKLGSNQKRTKEIIKEVLEKFKIEINLDEIKIVNSRIIINKTGPEKSEIFINQNKIEQEINNKLINEFGRKFNKKIN